MTLVLLPENLHTYFELSAQAWTLYKAPRKVIIKLLKLGCPSTYFQLSGHMLQ